MSDLMRLDIVGYVLLFASACFVKLSSVWITRMSGSVAASQHHAWVMRARCSVLGARCSVFVV
jgi:hypothetical protein